MKTVRDNVRGSRFKVPILIALGVLLILLLSANGLANTYTDWLWFDNLDVGSVWAKVLLTQITLAVVFTLTFFAILWGNLVLADRLAPDFRPASPEEDLIERYHQIVGARAGKLRFVLAAIFAVIAGANTATRWQEWMLFRNGGVFNFTDPIFGRDAGFYVFTLPFVSFVLDWLFAAIVLTLIVISVAHYLNGGIRASAAVERVTSGVKLHLSVLLAALAVVRAGGYWLDRFALLNSTRGIRDGALATDVNVQLPAYNLLALISLFGAALFLANIRRKGWGLPAAAIVLWGVSHLFVGSLFPALFQRLRVENQATTREAEFVAHNIEATRFAYGLDGLETESFTYASGLTAEEAEDYGPVLRNVPLLDPELAIDSFTRSEGERAFYEFADPLDVDRYEIDGEVRPVVLSMRGLNLGVNEVPAGWESQHIVFTHGYGAVAAAGWKVDSGSPSFLVRGLGDVGIDPGMTETLGQPRLYFGENFGGYAIVNAARPEVDFQTENSESQQYSYTGTGGVKMGSFLRRTAFALRFRQLDPLVAPAVSSDSEAIYIRDIGERVRTLAPFLRFDSNPYPVLANDQLYWVIDGYTTSNDFPYAETVDTDLTESELSGGYNYVRNSVKAVVDAYNGDVSFYVVNDADPVLQAWVSAFPELFSDISDIPVDLLDNLRYPEDVFTVQTDMWTTYKIDDPGQLIQGDVAWSVAAQPRTEAQVGESDTTVNSGSMDPQFLITRLPGSSDPEFVLQRAFIPRSGEAGSRTARPELTAIMMARSDWGANYGQLRVFEITTRDVQAPDFVHSEIRKNDELTEFVKEKIGSVVLFGEMTMLVVEDTIVYVRPVYVQAASRTAVPELSRVIAVNGDRISMGENLDEAIAGIIGDEDSSATAPTTDADAEADVDADADADADSGADTEAGTGEPAQTPTPAPETDYDPSGRSIVQLIADADSFLRLAAVAESNGEVQEAENLRAQARQALDEAQALLGGTPQTTTPANAATDT